MMQYFTYLPTLMEMDVTSDEKITVINSGIPSDMFNIICGVRNKDALDAAVEKFQDLEMPFACWIGFEDDYPHCERDLGKIGFFCDENESGMFVEIEKVSRKKKVEDLKIFPVDDEQKLVDFIEVYREMGPQEFKAISEFYLKGKKHILDQKSSLKFFVGYLENQPVAMSALFLDGDAAGIWCIATVPEFRQRGIGTDITCHALFQALDNFGYRIVVLAAGRLGEPVYRKIGFQKLKDFYVVNIKNLELT
jgi:ribosomal protein S18 acetylase RimI-like enzyme